VDKRLQVGNSSLGEVWVQVTATRAMMVVVYSSRGSSRDVESTNSGRVLVGFPGTGCVDCGIVGWILDVNLASIDTDNGTLKAFSQLSDS
jgi:hypothetical protein